MYEQDLVLNNIQWLICHKTQPNQIIYIQYIYIYLMPNPVYITYNGWYDIKAKQTKLYIYLIYMFKEDLALNNLEGLICHKIKPNQIIYI